jgi:phage-related protein
VVQAVKPLIPPLLELIKGALLPLLPAVVAILKPVTQLVAALTPLITLVANILAVVISLITKGLTPVITVIANLVSWLVGGLVKGLTGIITPFNSVGDVAKKVFDWVKDNWPLLVAILTGPIGIAVLAIVRNFDSIRDGINTVVGWFRDLPGRVASGISAGLKAIWNVINGINDRIRSTFNIDLLAAGRKILESLLDGMKQAGQKVVDFAQGIADKVKGLWPFSPAEWGPFRANPPEKAGAKLVQLWAKGIESQERTMERAAERIAGAATVDGSGNFSLAGANVAGTAAGAGATPLARSGPAVVIQEAIFKDELDVDSFMRQATWAVQVSGI